MSRRAPSRTVTCFHCGGNVELSVQQPQTVCPYCHVELELHGALRRDADHYERAEKTLLGREALARRKAALHARAARHNGP